MLAILTSCSVAVSDHHLAELPIHGAAELIHTRAPYPSRTLPLTPMGDAAVNQRGAKYPRIRVKTPLTMVRVDRPGNGGRSLPRVEPRGLLAAGERMGQVQGGVQG